MSFEDISKLSGLSKGYICDVANFKKMPSQISILKISRAFGLRAELVFNLDYTKVDL
jgi:transcriptional regulator with XRE-family HTH domain